VNSAQSELLANEPARRVRILRLLLTVGETSAPYNQFSLAWRDRYDITVCALFEPTIPTSPQLRVFPGNGSVRGFLQALRAALREREYDLVHAHSPHVAFLFLLAMLVSRRKSPPTVYTLHTSYPNLKLRNMLLLVPVFARFRRLVCCSQSSLESFPRFFRWLGGSRLCAIPNGVDIERVDRALASRPRQSSKDEFTVVAIGRLMELKNPLLILGAFREISDTKNRLRFIGTGPLHDVILQASQASGLMQRVELAGLIPREEVYTTLHGADLYVSASRCEGLPIAALEAMVCRCPVVLSDIPPHREIADGADFIPLVPLNDAAGLARELRRFREMPVERRSEIGDKCRKLVEDRFSLGEMECGYEAIYAEIRAGASSPDPRRARVKARESRPGASADSS
jgi:glycosyltransferase involved in cell wall biosynthesis